ncbi:MAG: alpha/beta fold hydrolase [Anaerolineales bacterium]
MHLVDHLTSSYIPCGDVRLHVMQAGPAEGPPAILLHGFPEFWYGWRHQILPLAEAGFRVIIPDQRGYNESDKPPDTSAYMLDHLARDIVVLMDSLGHARVHLAGHDWGAAVAWEIAETYPERLHSLTILNVPHTRVMDRAMQRANLRQMRKSWYIATFQIPGLAERWLPCKDYQALEQLFLKRSMPGAFTAEDFVQYRVAWGQPNAIPSMVAWYRAAAQSLGERAKRPWPQITVPTRILWGAQDAFVDARLAEQSAALCNHATLKLFPENGHFVQHEQPEAVASELIDWMTQHL